MKHLTFALFVFSINLNIPFAGADDWPQWLGSQRDSVWREKGILDRFPKNGPKLRWATKIASGYSGPAVANGRVYLMDRVATPVKNPKVLNKRPPRNYNFLRKLLPGSERVLCLRESDGKVLWKYKYDCPYTTVSMYAIGPRMTPTVDGDRVYTLGAEGNLICLRTSNGQEVWKVDFKKQYGLKTPNWGTSCCPLVDGNKLICIVGGKDSTCVAFDKRTGKELWRALSSREPGYSSPVIYTIGGRRQLIIWHSDSVNALNPQTGKTIWSVPFRATFGMSIAVPRLAGRRLYVMCFAGKSAVIEISKDGGSAEIQWSGAPKRGIPGVHNTPFLHNGHIYGCGNGGRYICAKLQDGQWLWSTFRPASAKRPISWGNVFTVRHEDRYFLANDVGDVIIAKMSPAGYEEISRANLIQPTHQVGRRTLVWSHPAFANKSIYLRNDKEIRCYSLASP